MRARQGKVNDRQQHYHESIDKEWAISQNENVTENYGGHPHNKQIRRQSPRLLEEEQKPHHPLQHPRTQPENRLGYPPLDNLRQLVKQSGRAWPPLKH